MAQRIVGDFGQGSGEFDAGGTRTDDHKRQPTAASFGIRLALGGFERVEDLMTDASGVFERLETRRDGLPRVFVAEIEMTGSCGDDQRIVRNIAFVQNHAAAGGVEIDSIGEQHLGVFLLTQQDAQRRGDFARRQSAGGYLVQQRLKKMEVAAVDQRYGERSHV